jgi:D-amino-acid oxidase
MSSMDRRALLKTLAGATVAGLAPACSGGRRNPNVTLAIPPHQRTLARVLVRPERVIREVAGLRPYRPSGFRVEADAVGSKLLIHNYGHGGGGVSLSWGSAYLAVLLALASPHRSAAVLGAGAVGLATARLLQDRGFEVTIYTRDLPPDTTSNLAGAQWAPVSLVAPDRVTPAFRERYVAASRFAYRYFQTLVGDRYGVRWLENYFLSRAAPQNEEWGYATLFQELLRVETLPPGAHPFAVPFVRRVLTMHIDTSHYLRQVMEDFHVAGGRVVVRDFPDPASVTALAEPVVVNCTGLGAAALFGDRELVPAKGQLVVLAPQPEVDYITIGPGPGVMYMMPRRDGIILGGSFVQGDGTTTPDPAQGERILRGHAELFEGMT